MFEVHGYALVSADDRIADADGRTPDSLRNEADWAYFQGELDRAALVVLGRLGHEANPNPGRRRMIVTSRVARLERWREGWLWNPAQVPWPEAAAAALPDGGRVAVPGGRRVFDLFLAIGYDAFHLSRAERVRVPDGVPLFSAPEPAEAVLAAHGLVPRERAALDPAAGISLTVWRRATPR
jgi:hypothetical protein